MFFDLKSSFIYLTFWSLWRPFCSSASEATLSLSLPSISSSLVSVSVSLTENEFGTPWKLFTHRQQKKFIWLVIPHSIPFPNPHPHSPCTVDAVADFLGVSSNSKALLDHSFSIIQPSSHCV
jgi:hypothetical protein